MNWFAHAEAPLTSRALPTSAGGASTRTTPSNRAAASMRITASGSSTASSPSRSPPRAAVRNASTTSRWRALSVSDGARRAAHPPPRAARELLCCGRRPSDDGTDLRERYGEQVVQDERQPFGRRQRVEHDEQRHPNRVREHGFTLGIRTFSTCDTVGSVSRACRSPVRNAISASEACPGTRVRRRSSASRRGFRHWLRRRG